MKPWEEYQDTPNNTPENAPWLEYQDEGVKEQPTQPKELNLLGNIYTRPAAAIRGAIQNPLHPIQGYIQGALQPEKIPTMQQKFLDWYWNKVGKTTEKMTPPQAKIHTGIMAIPGFGVSALGYGADILTNPGELLTTMGAGAVSKAVAPTKVGQAIQRFFTKERKFLKFGKRAVQDIVEKAVRGKTSIFGQMNDKYEKLFDEIKEGSTKIDDIADAVNTARVNAFPNSAIERKMTQLSERLENFNEMSAPQLQKMKQEVGKILSKNIWSGQARANPEQHFVKEVYKSINDALARIGGEKYTGLAKEYKDFINMVDEVNSVLLQRGKPTDIKLARRLGFSLSTPQREALEKLNWMLPPEQQFMQDFLAWRRGQMLKYLIGGLGLGGLGLGIKKRIAETIPSGE